MRTIARPTCVWIRRKGLSRPSYETHWQKGNCCNDCDRGIDVDDDRNTIARNTCGFNSMNWDVVAGNFLLVIAQPAAGAVIGNSGGVSTGTDPNANFTH